MDNLDIVFLGGLFPENCKAEIRAKSKGCIQYAADALQWNIVDGLEDNLERPINLLNAVFLGSYPSLYQDIYIKPYCFSHRDGAKDKSIGFLNIFGLKQIIRAVNTRRELGKWARQKSNEKVLLIYSMHMPFIYAAAAAKRINPEIQICLIVPDLPEFMNLNVNMSPLVKVLKRFDSALIRKSISSIDFFVILTKYMAEKIPVLDKPYIVMEGMVNKKDINSEMNFSGLKEKTLLYTGTLNKAYGILTLLEAFELTQNDDDFRLVICGAGEAEPEVKNYMQKDCRIQYLGLLERDQVLKLQQNCRALINPRNANGEFTKYSFPSKNLEYLLSGRPVIAYKLPGIPDEYDEFFYYIHGNSPKDMAAAIQDVLNKDDDALSDLGEKARKFVLTEKNNVVQTKRIIDMIKDRQG